MKSISGSKLHLTSMDSNSVIIRRSRNVMGLWQQIMMIHSSGAQADWRINSIIDITNIFNLPIFWLKRNTEKTDLEKNFSVFLKKKLKYLALNIFIHGLRDMK